MPYIQSNRRAVVDMEIPNVDVTGELNYQITQVVQNYLKFNGLSYATINDIIGALEGAKLEFYRRVAEPYEKTKITLNGDVYDQEFIRRGADVGIGIVRHSTNTPA